MLQSCAIAAAAEDLAQIRRLRLASFVEATTLLILLLVAVPLKHAFGYPCDQDHGAGAWRGIRRLCTGA